MIWFPQLSSGSAAQFPIVRSRSWRSISNRLEDESLIFLPDTAAGQVEWRFSYQDLSDAEKQRLDDLFAQVQGRFGSFAFIDPMANLLGWSEDLSQPDWQAGLLQTQSNILDPVGTHRAWSLTNTSAGAQSLTQSVTVSGEYVCCFSAWARRASPGTVVIARDSSQVTVRAGTSWKRISIGGQGVAGADASTCSITLGPGQTVELWGLQLEAQPHASSYKATGPAQGSYENTSFGMDELTFRSDGVGRSSCGFVLTSQI
jgi:hypothetical protein